MKAAVFIVLVILGGIIFWFLARRFERSQMYFPQQMLEADPSGIGLAYEDITLRAADGVRLHGWWIPAESPRGTILFCHGNAGNVSHRLESIQIFNSLGLNVLIFDYRGYGRSEGSPSEEGTYLDAGAAYDYLRKERKIDPGSIIIFGRSLGGAVAAELVNRKEAAALICESTFTSAVDMAKMLFPGLPVGLLVFDRYETISKVGSLALPKLFIHSREDELIPLRQGRRLYDTASPPKEFFEIRGSHGEGFLETGDGYRQAIDAFLRRHLPG